MAKVHKRIFSDGTLIRIVEGADDICSGCPHLTDGRCESDSSPPVEDKDAVVIARSGLVPGSRIIPKEAYRLVESAFSPEDLPEVCGNCPWLELGFCADGLRASRSYRYRPS